MELTRVWFFNQLGLKSFVAVWCSHCYYWAQMVFDVSRSLGAAKAHC
jgi:hypothetical protein